LNADGPCYIRGLLGTLPELQAAAPLGPPHYLVAPAQYGRPTST